MPIVPSTEGTAVGGLGANYWNQTRDVEAPSLCQLLDQVALYQVLRWVSVLAARSWSRNRVCPQSCLGTRLIEVSMLMAGAGPHTQSICMVLAAGRECVSLSSPNLLCVMGRRRMYVFVFASHLQVGSSGE